MENKSEMYISLKTKTPFHFVKMHDAQ